MADVQSCTPEGLCGGTPSKTRVERTIKHGDTTYELFVGPCQCGDHPIFRLMRSCGASLSIYQITDRDRENLDEYVSELHESFTVDVEAKLLRLRETILVFNDKGLFEAENMDVFHVRLIDKARLILSRLAKNGLLQQIINHPDDANNDVASAFLLGCLATENFWIETHEQAVFEGYAHIEGREAGRPLAHAARVRQGKRTRKAVLDAASKVYGKNPELHRNDSRTASRIAEMRLESLRKRDGTYLGADAIIKHLRGARRTSNPLGKSQ